MRRETTIDMLAFIGAILLALAAYLFGGYVGLLAYGGVLCLSLALVMSLAESKRP